MLDFDYLVLLYFVLQLLIYSNTEPGFIDNKPSPMARTAQYSLHCFVLFGSVACTIIDSGAYSN